jgi:hypothetical protein
LKVKKNGRLWTVNVAIAKQLYEYKYPFQINEYFLTWKTNYQFQVKTQIIELIAKNSLKKEFYIQEFLKRFNLSNKKQTQIKQMLIEAISANKKSVDTTQFKIIQKDGSVKKLTNFKLKILHKLNLFISMKMSIINLYFNKSKCRI